MMDDDVLPIAHEILAESELMRDEVELSKSYNPSKPLMSIPVNKKESPSKSPCIAEAFAAVRNARKRIVILGGSRGDQNERLDAANGSESAKEKDFMVVAGDTSALKRETYKDTEGLYRCKLCNKLIASDYLQNGVTVLTKEQVAEKELKYSEPYILPLANAKLQPMEFASNWHTNTLKEISELQYSIISRIDAMVKAKQSATPSTSAAALPLASQQLIPLNYSTSASRFILPRMFLALQSSAILPDDFPQSKSLRNERKSVATSVRKKGISLLNALNKKMFWECCSPKKYEYEVMYCNKFEKHDIPISEYMQYESEEDETSDSTSSESPLEALSTFSDDTSSVMFNMVRKPYAFPKKTKVRAESSSSSSPTTTSGSEESEPSWMKKRRPSTLNLSKKEQRDYRPLPLFSNIVEQAEEIAKTEEWRGMIHPDLRKYQDDLADAFNPSLRWGNLAKNLSAPHHRYTCGEMVCQLSNLEDYLWQGFMDDASMQYDEQMAGELDFNLANAFPEPDSISNSDSEVINEDNEVRRLNLIKMETDDVQVEEPSTSTFASSTSLKGVS
ncbi:hypothetical protein L7F22_063966 [Adiantum nelumboides]|nr:hypothetical protein [Adiantum nelumboides]